MAEAGPSAQSPDPTAQAALTEALRARLEIAELKAQLASHAVVTASSATKAPPPVPAAARLHLLQIQAVRDGLIVAALLVLLWIGYEISLVTVPILLAMLLAYLFEPLVRVMTRTRIFSRPGAALIIIFASLLLFVGPVTVGLGTAVVQGATVARGVARTTENLLVVLRFSQTSLDGGEHAGKLEFDPPIAATGETGTSSVKDATTPSATGPTGDTAATGTTGAAIPTTAPDATGVTGANASRDVSGATGSTGARVTPRTLTEQPTERVTFLPSDPTDETQKKAATRANAAYENLRPKLREAVTKLLRHNAELQQREAAAAAGVAPTSPVAAKTPLWLLTMDMGVAWLQNNTEAVAGAVGKGALGTGAEAVTAAVKTLRWIGRLGLTLVLTAFFFYFFSTGYAKVLAFWESLIPERKKGRAIELVQRMDRAIAGFVRGRLTICAVLMAVYTAGYWAIGVPAPLVLGPIVGALALVPFVTLIAVPLAIILMTLEPSTVDWQQNWWWIAGAPIGMWCLERALDDYILTPTIQGKHTEMAIPAILFASLSGGALAGVYGLLIAIPVAACVNILLKEVFWPRFAQWARGQRKDFLPIESEGTWGAT